MAKQTPLQAAAAKADDAQTKKKARGVLASLAALLGVGGAEATAPAARMSKRTETTKHTIVEEDDSDDAEEEAEDSEAEEEMESESDKMDSEADSEADSSEEEEEEEEERAGASEEEEEKAIAKAWAAAEKAYAKAAKGVDAYGVFGPKGAKKAMFKATGATSIKGALSALSSSRKTAAKAAAKGDAKVIKAQAELAARVQKVETDNLVQRVAAMVDAAKAAGKAPTKALRAQLREHGNAHGTKALGALIASLPVVASTKVKIAKHDEQGNPVGGPSATVQAMEKAMFAHITDPKERAEAIAEYRAKLAERTNAAGGDA